MTSFIKTNNINFSKLTDDCSLSQEELANCLDLGVEMLFYIEAETFDRKDIQNVVFALKRIIEHLRSENNF